MEKILLIGAAGQIGTVLTKALRNAYGPANVLATDLNTLDEQDGPTAVLDATSAGAVAELVSRFKPSQMYHLAAILLSSALGHPKSEL